MFIYYNTKSKYIYNEWYTQVSEWVCVYSISVQILSSRTITFSIKTGGGGGGAIITLLLSTYTCIYQGGNVCAYTYVMWVLIHKESYSTFIHVFFSQNAKTWNSLCWTRYQNKNMQYRCELWLRAEGEERELNRRW